MKSKRSFRALSALLLGAALLPGALAAQSQLDTSQAQAFLGNWTINMQTDMGPFTFALNVTDQGGKVGATMSSTELGNQTITDITRDEAYLVLAFTADAQGQQFPVTVSLEPNGANLDVYFDVADGMFSATGTATKSAS